MKRVKVPVSEATLVMFPSVSSARAHMIAKGMDPDVDEHNCVGFVTRAGGYIIMAAPPGDHNTIAHESVHTACAILENMNVESRDEELVAYYTGWAAEKFYAAYSE